MPKEAEEATGSPRAGVTGCCELPQETKLRVSEPSHHPLFEVFLNIISVASVEELRMEVQLSVQGQPT